MATTKKQVTDETSVVASSEVEEVAGDVTKESDKKVTSKTEKEENVSKEVKPIKTIEQVVVVKDITTMEDLIKQVPELPQFEVGDLVEGVVVSVDKGQVVVDIDSVCTGVILGTEMEDSASTAKNVMPGGTIQAVVINTENEQGQLILSLKRASQENTWERFKNAYESGDVVGMVMKEANKGGLLVEIDGIRGFLPVSQLTPEHYPRVSGADPSKILSKLNKLVSIELKVKIINIDYNERRLIISEKEAYHEERQAVIDELQVGQTIEGKVSGVVNFGIFVNFKGIEGLVHISEIAWGHVSDPSDYAKVGDSIKVLVIGVEGDKISFSMKRLTPDPWIAAAERYKIGEKVKGKVTRITPFGAFVKLDEEIDGLIHVSELSEAEESGEEHTGKEQNVIDVGSEIEAKIISIDVDEHRLGLSIRSEESKATKAKKEAKEVKKAEEDEESSEKEVA
jgi:small subunit ribosomal protein S1